MDIRQLRAIHQAALDVPSEAVREGIGEMESRLHELAEKYAGECPPMGTEDFRAWSLRCKGFELLVTTALSRVFSL